VRLLVDHGAALEATNKLGRTALHFAVNPLVGPVDIELVRYLILSGANVNAWSGANSKRGFTALLYAIEKNVDPLDVMELLLASGADHNARSKGSGWAALDRAIVYQYQQDNIALFETLIRYGADVNIKPESGQYGWLLGRAAERRLSAIVRLLIRSGAEIDAVSERFGTALHRAARWAYDDIVEILLVAGADPNVRDDERTGRHSKYSRGIWTFSPCWRGGRKSVQRRGENPA
jgi:uncharacterized protein